MMAFVITLGEIIQQLRLEIRVSHLFLASHSEWRCLRCNTCYKSKKVSHISTYINCTDTGLVSHPHFNGTKQQIRHLFLVFRSILTRTSICQFVYFPLLLLFLIDLCFTITNTVFGLFLILFGQGLIHKVVRDNRPGIQAPICNWWLSYNKFFYLSIPLFLCDASCP